MSGESGVGSWRSATNQTFFFKKKIPLPKRHLVIVYSDFRDGIKARFVHPASPSVHRRQVLFEGRLVLEIHVTTVTLIRPVPTVDVEMVLEGALGGESLQTHHALERADAHVAADMPVEVLLLSEGFPTLQAQEELVHL